MRPTRPGLPVLPQSPVHLHAPQQPTTQHMFDGFPPPMDGIQTHLRLTRSCADFPAVTVSVSPNPPVEANSAGRHNRISSREGLHPPARCCGRTSLISGMRLRQYSHWHGSREIHWWAMARPQCREGLPGPNLAFRVPRRHFRWDYLQKQGILITPLAAFLQVA